MISYRRLVASLISLAAPLLLANAPAHVGTVALTFDDLPVFGAFTSAGEGDRITEELLAGLQRHHWTATGFVNELQLQAPDKQQRVALLQKWLDAGMDLGNHTYSHLSLNATPVDAYVADIRRDEEETGRLLAATGRRERWFRYPYLETGSTREKHDRVAAWLTQHGYRVAPVTMENSDWQFSAPFDDALMHGDVREARRIRERYLRYTRAAVAWYIAAGRRLFGRQPSFVFLLHASRLNAASIDRLSDILRRTKLRVMPLDNAMEDPAYRTADHYVGPDGNEWLERWSETLHRDLHFESFPKVPAAIAKRDAELEASGDQHSLDQAPVPSSRVVECCRTS